MRISVFLILSMIFTMEIKAQEGLEEWEQEIIAQANTAKAVSYLTEEEKQVIFLANLARMDGELFANTILDSYLEGKDKNRYTRSLYKDLAKVENLPMLKPEKDLHQVAEEHAEKSGKRGTTGHERFNKRYEPLLRKYNEVGENLAYGYSQAIDIVIQLLIDEGVPSLGHRKNILSPNFNAIGVSIKDHKNYGSNAVMAFGKRVK